LLGFVGAKAATFEIAIQLGAILSVVVLYYRRMLDLLSLGQSSGSGAVSTLKGRPGLCRIALASLPALVAGYLFHDVIKSRLFTPVAVSWALAVGGVAILFAERWVSRQSPRSLETLTLKQALGIGLFQVLSLWPGTSRSAATIVGGLLLGLDRKGAAEFSFLIAVPVMMVASGYDVLMLSAALTSDDIAQFGVGFAVSFVVALLSIKTFILLLSRWTLTPFAWYRIVAAPIFYWLTRGAGLPEP
ncbi:MAG: undecaprenyl-diphosphate phosphatase, partial [Methyloceanibacter sp.]